MAIKRSLNAKLYYGTAGTTAATELTTVGDVTTSIKKAEAKVASRASGWNLTYGTMKDADVSFSIAGDDGDTHLNALITAFNNDTPLAFKVLDKASGKGIDADFEILSLDRDEKLEDVVSYKFTIKPTYVTRYPTWVG